MMKLTLSKILFLGAIALTGNLAYAEPATPASTTVVTTGPCPEGMTKVVGPHITWDTSTTADDQQNVPAPAPGVCMEVSQTLILHAAPPPPSSPPTELLQSLDDDEVEPIADEPTSPVAQAQKQGRWSLGVLLGYPSEQFGPVALATLSGTFRRGELGELRLEGSAGMTKDKVAILGASALVYGHLSRHTLLAIGPTLTYQTTFSDMDEDPTVRQLGAAAEIAYQVKVSSPTDLDLELFARVGGAWQRVDGPELGPLKDSAKVPVYIGWRGLF